MAFTHNQDKLVESKYKGRRDSRENKLGKSSLEITKTKLSSEHTDSNSLQHGLYQDKLSIGGREKRIYADLRYPKEHAICLKS